MPKSKNYKTPNTPNTEYKNQISPTSEYKNKNIKVYFTKDFIFEPK